VKYRPSFFEIRHSMTVRKWASNMELPTHLTTITDRLRSLERVAADQPPSLTLGAVLNELSVTVEELQVVTEELFTQNEQLQQVRDELERERQHGRDLFDHSPVAMMITDVDGRLERHNARARQLFEPRRLVHKFIYTVFNVDDRRPLSGLLAATVGGRMAEPVVASLDNPAAVRVVCSITPIGPSGDRHYLWSLLPGGFTRRSVDRELADLRRLSSARGGVCLALIHDVQNPLAAITGFLALLRDGEDRWSDDDRRQMIVRSAHAADSLARLIGGLANLVDGIGLAETRSFAALGDVVAKVIAEHSPAAGVVLDLVETERRLRVPESTVAHVVGNLVRNALDHAGEGAAVRVSAYRIAQGVHLVVEDDGPGVPVGDRQRIFSPGARNAGDGHRGLGLTIVRYLALAHGGAVWVTDSQLGGAAFHVDLLLGDNEHPSER
jgi:signal transduction histidine kinase